MNFRSTTKIFCIRPIQYFGCTYIKNSWFIWNIIHDLEFKFNLTSCISSGNPLVGVSPRLGSQSRITYTHLPTSVSCPPHALFPSPCRPQFHGQPGKDSLCLLLRGRPHTHCSEPPFPTNMPCVPLSWSIWSSLPLLNTVGGNVGQGVVGKPGACLNLMRGSSNIFLVHPN